jgi:lactoylglutathione lyase
MVETGGTARPEGKSVAQGSAKLRFNVANIENALTDVEAFGIRAEITTNGWGSTIDIHDPDGNRIGIRDDASFSQQIEG